MPGEARPVIRIAVADPPLTPAEQYGLDVLVDLSRLIVLAGVEPATPSGAGSAGPSPKGSSNVVTVRIPPAMPDHEGSDAAESSITRLERGIELGDDGVTVQRSLLRAVTDVAGAGIEQRASSRDRYDRVSSGDNPLVAVGREREPVVSMTAASLRAAVTRVAGRRPVLCVAPWPSGYRWCAAFSHDLDVVAGWPLFSALRVTELARKHRFDDVRAVLRAALRDARSEPVWSGVRGVLDA
jgi:hypothetical protein